MMAPTGPRGLKVIVLVLEVFFLWNMGFNVLKLPSACRVMLVCLDLLEIRFLSPSELLVCV